MRYSGRSDLQGPVRLRAGSFEREVRAGAADWQVGDYYDYFTHSWWCPLTDEEAARSALDHEFNPERKQHDVVG